jgi:predicted ATP-dependent serine protease
MRVTTPWQDMNDHLNGGFPENSVNLIVGQVGHGAQYTLRRIAAHAWAHDCRVLLALQETTIGNFLDRQVESDNVFVSKRGRTALFSRNPIVDALPSQALIIIEAREIEEIQRAVRQYQNVDAIMVESVDAMTKSSMVTKARYLRVESIFEDLRREAFRRTLVIGSQLSRSSVSDSTAMVKTMMYGAHVVFKVHSEGGTMTGTFSKNAFGIDSHVVTLRDHGEGV